MYFRHIFDLISCATEEIRDLGADCDFGSSYTGELVYKYFRDNVVDGQLLPEAPAQVMMYCEGNKFTKYFIEVLKILMSETNLFLQHTIIQPIPDQVHENCCACACE